MEGQPTRAEARRRRRRRRAVATTIQVAGEVLLTAGVGVLFFLAWQLWINDAIVGNEQTVEAAAIAESWAAPDAPAVPPEALLPADPAEPEAPPVLREPEAIGTVFATIRIPRFGEDYVKRIAQGTPLEPVLNRIGVGHYVGTAMPGQVGNFAVAGHRTTWGSPFSQIERLRVGDSIYIETKAGWYRYVYRDHEVVLPTSVEVLAEVPGVPAMRPGDRIMTMTSCHPRFYATERFIAYAVYDSWWPRSDGPPPELAGSERA